MPAINFFQEDVQFKVTHPIKVRRWIKTCIEAEGFKLKEINFVFTSDEFLRSINQEYLSHSTYTDIVTFDNSENPEEIEGDIFISIHRVEENSKKFEESFNRELCRVLIHGVLHLVGYSDKKSTEKLKMREKENWYLSLLDVPRETRAST